MDLLVVLHEKFEATEQSEKNIIVSYVLAICKKLKDKTDTVKELLTSAWESQIMPDYFDIAI